MTADGNADLTYTWTKDALSTTTYATSENGTAITNQLSSADPNLYEGIEETVTWLSRSDWNGTLPTETVKLALTELAQEGPEGHPLQSCRLREHRDAHPGRERR